MIQALDDCLMSLYLIKWKCILVKIEKLNVVHNKTSLCLFLQVTRLWLTTLPRVR